MGSRVSSILVVDDESTIRSFLVRVLAREGYEVQAAEDGREALRILEASTFDLLLTDIKMDRLDGVGLLQVVRSRYPEMAVILLTGHATVASAIAALRQGAHDYLLKPVKNEDILAAVEAALAESAREQRRNRLEQLASQMLDLVQSAPGDHPPQVSPAGRAIAYGGLELNPETYSATLSGAPLELTPTEFRLLTELSRAPGTVFGYIHLVQAACGYTCTRQEAQEIIGTHIRNLRQKLGTEPDQPLYVDSVRGIGYRLIPLPEDA